MRSTRTLLVAATLSTAVALPAGVMAKTPAPTLQVTPKKVAIGAKATVTGKNLPAHSYFTFILLVPNASNPAAKALVSALGRSDAKGNMKVTVQMPIVVKCGPASLYMGTAKKPLMVRARVTLKGCTAPKKAPPPPPPPSSPKP